VRRPGHAGEVSELGARGPVVHGGAWLTVGGVAVDVLFRDLDAVEAALVAASPPLAGTASTRWEGQASVALLFAGGRARARDPVGCAGCSPSRP